MNRANGLNGARLAKLAAAVCAAFVVAALLAFTGCSDQGAISQGAQVTMQQAEEIALAAAGISADDALGIDIVEEGEDGAECFVVTFETDTSAYSYTIEKATGEITAKSSDKKSAISAEPAAESKSSKNGISSLGANSASNGTATNKSGSPDDGVSSSGESSKSSDGFKSSKNSDSSASSSSKSSSASYISASKAKSIALGHAGVSSGKATFTKVERGKENGIAIYEVEFETKSAEYEFVINAKTGKVISWEKDSHDSSRSSASSDDDDDDGDDDDDDDDD